MFDVPVGSRFIVTVTRIRAGEARHGWATAGSPYPGRMRVELPEGYVPPEPTHPMYGYLTPQEQEAFEAEERVRRGIVPGVVAVSEVPRVAEAEEAPASSWAPPVPHAARAARARGGDRARSSANRTRPSRPRRRRSGVPAGSRAPPPDPPPTRPKPVALGAVGEFRWDASRQEWVSTATPAPVAAEQRRPDVAAAAGGRGASSSWTSARRVSGSAGTRGRSAGSPSHRSRPASGLARARAMEHTGPRARVAEWQTRWLQVPVPERAWGFKSPLAHRRTSSVNAVDLTPYWGCDPPRCRSRAGYPMRRARWTVRPLSSSRSSRTAANAIMCGVSRWASRCSAVSQFSRTRRVLDPWCRS